MKIKGRAWLRRFTFLLVILFEKVVPLSLTIGCGVIGLGIILHIWAIGCLVRNSQITNWGPYRFVRHPFYLANFLIDIGICIASANPWIIGIYPILFVLIYHRRMLKEESHLTGLFPEDYPQYMQQTSRFIPLPWKRAPKTNNGFSWTILVSSGNEIARVLHLLIYPMILYLLLKRFDSGLFDLLIQENGYRAIIVDMVPGKIDYQEIIILSVIALSLFSAFFHRNKNKEPS